MIIREPGFYASKAGKCEVVAVHEGIAFGFVHSGTGKYVRVWTRSNGAQAYVDPLCDHDIIGPWQDKPKPIEAWAVLCERGACDKVFLNASVASEYALARDKYHPRLVHLREVTEETK